MARRINPARVGAVYVAGDLLHARRRVVRNFLRGSSLAGVGRWSLPPGRRAEIKVVLAQGWKAARVRDAGGIGKRVAVHAVGKRICIRDSALMPGRVSDRERRTRRVVVAVAR